MTYHGLKRLLENGACELRFTRRHPKTGHSNIRMMICTNSKKILNSPVGRINLNYKPPTHSPNYIPESYGLITVWDILIQNFRNIPFNSVVVLRTIPDSEFEEYLANDLYPMSPQQKMRYMG